MKMRTIPATLAVVLLAISSSGCAAIGHPHRLAVAPPRNLGELIYSATVVMDQRAGLIAKDRPIMVSTVVSIDNLNKSSTFGRLASQLVANRLSQSGYWIKDATYVRAWNVRPGTGELVLSDDVTRMSTSVNAQAIVAGTYAVAGKEIFLSLRLLRAADGYVLSSADIAIPLDRNTEPLIEDSGAIQKTGY